MLYLLVCLHADLPTYLLTYLLQYLLIDLFIYSYLEMYSIEFRKSFSDFSTIPVRHVVRKVDRKVSRTQIERVPKSLLEAFPEKSETACNPVIQSIAN